MKKKVFTMIEFATIDATVACMQKNKQIVLTQKVIKK